VGGWGIWCVGLGLWRVPRRVSALRVFSLSLSLRGFLLRGIHRVAIVSNWASPGKQDGRCGIHRKYA